MTTTKIGNMKKWTNWLRRPTLTIPGRHSKVIVYDPYVKAIKWASDRIEKEGVVAFITNRKFIDGESFDGMRKHLAADFDTIYILDLGGDVREGLKVSDANVFGITVGVSINFFIKSSDNPKSPSRNLLRPC